MYKTFTPEEYKQVFGLPLDYRVEALVAYGTWDTNKILNCFIENLQLLKIKFEAKRMDGFLSDILEIKVKDKIYWFGVVYGSAKLSEYVHLACIFGSKKNISIGSCGGLYTKGNSADIIIPTCSYGNESSTRMYERNNKKYLYKTNKKLSDLLRSNISKNFKVLKGKIITCQAMLGETFEDVKTWSKKGYLGVEMETATMFAVSNHFKVPTAAVIYISDNLIKGQTIADTSHISEKTKREATKTEIYKSVILTVLE